MRYEAEGGAWVERVNGGAQVGYVLDGVAVDVVTLSPSGPGLWTGAVEVEVKVEGKPERVLLVTALAWVGTHYLLGARAIGLHPGKMLAGQPHEWACWPVVVEGGEAN